MSERKLLLAIISMVLLAGGTATLQAQERGKVLEEITVTATKRGAVSLQDVPTSAVALNEDTLKKMGAVGIDDVTRSVAALDVVDTGPGQKQYLIRGINAEGESTVGLLIDNVPLVGGGNDSRRAGTNLPDFNLFDMARIEVLRGPQGTLYGANSVAGIVRYVTNKPDFNGVDFSVQAGLSTFAGEGEASHNINAMGNMVLVEEVL